MNAKRRDVYWDDRDTFRTDSEVRGALSTARDRLARSNRLKFRGKKITREATFAALCLWADAQDVRVLEDHLAPFVEMVERLVAAKEKGAGSGGTGGGGGGPITFDEDETKPRLASPAVPTRTARTRRKIS